MNSAVSSDYSRGDILTTFHEGTCIVIGAVKRGKIKIAYSLNKDCYETYDVDTRKRSDDGFIITKKSKIKNPSESDKELVMNQFASYLKEHSCNESIVYI